MITIVSVILISSILLTSGSVLASRSGPNWLKICQTFDKFIAEPCGTLTSPDGFQLTEKGKKVLICFLLGGLGKILGYSDEELRQYAPLGGCGGPVQPQPTEPVQPQPMEPVQPQPLCGPNEVYTGTDENGLVYCAAEDTIIEPSNPTEGNMTGNMTGGCWAEDCIEYCKNNDCTTLQKSIMFPLFNFL